VINDPDNESPNNFATSEGGYMIAVIGSSGVVGGAVTKAFSKVMEVVKVDSTSNQSIYSDVSKCDVVFICVPTPSSEDGSVNMSICDEVVEKLKDNKQIVVIKSTVPPLTNKRYSKKYPNLSFVSSPEFLTEATPYEDFIHPDRIVIGADNVSVIEKVSGYYDQAIPNARIIIMNPIEAELVKYGANAFLALKVIYFNEFKYVCDLLGADFEPVRAGICTDKRIGFSHSSVTPEGGYSGMCFPKDTKGIAHLLKEKNIGVHLLQILPELNKRWRKA
jgi:UDPglucose 6-dehydrogenase